MRGIMTFLAVFVAMAAQASAQPNCTISVIDTYKDTAVMSLLKEKGYDPIPADGDVPEARLHLSLGQVISSEPCSTDEFSFAKATMYVGIIDNQNLTQNVVYDSASAADYEVKDATLRYEMVPRNTCASFYSAMLAAIAKLKDCSRLGHK